MVIVTTIQIFKRLEQRNLRCKDLDIFGREKVTTKQIVLSYGLLNNKNIEEGTPLAHLCFELHFS